MKKNYVLFLFTAFILLTVQFNYAQNKDIQSIGEQKIEDLSIYPNPVNSEQNIIYLTSKMNTSKHIEFYDVLGKRIFSTKIRTKELNISNLTKGVYILKITENDISETRKLVIR